MPPDKTKIVVARFAQSMAEILYERVSVCSTREL